MERDVLHVVTPVEDLLGAVAVVVVDVEDRHLRPGGRGDVVGCDRGVVEEAVPAVEARRSVMSRRPAEPVHVATAIEHRRRCRQRDVDRRASSTVRALRDGCRGLETPPAELVIDGGPFGERTDAVDEAGHGEHVRHDIVGSGMTHLVLGPRAFEEPHQPGIVDRLDRGGVPGVGLDQFETIIGSERLADRVRSTRVLERRLQPGRLDLGERSVPTMSIGGDHQHRRPHRSAEDPGTTQRVGAVGLDEHRRKRQFEAELSVRPMGGPVDRAVRPPLESAHPLDEDVARESVGVAVDEEQPCRRGPSPDRSRCWR